MAKQARASSPKVARWVAVLAVPLLGPGACPLDPPPRFSGPTSSQPLALTADGSFLVVANPDSDTASFFDLRRDCNRRVAEVPVGDEPNGAAFLPHSGKAYIANTASGTVSVIRANLGVGQGSVSPPRRHIPVGTEPYGLALTPNGTRLYVANARSNDVTVIDTATDRVLRTIWDVGPEPRGLAITNDGDRDDRDETVYVTNFLALPRFPGEDGSDDARSAFATVISTATDTVRGQIELLPIEDTGFKASGDALRRIRPGASFDFTTGAFPNQLNQIAVKGGFAYVPNTGASPNGPVRFDVNLQSLVHVIDLASASDARRTINLQRAIASQASPDRRFVSVPWALAFEHASSEAFVVSAASDVLVKLAVDPVTGAPAVQLDPSDPTRVLEIPTGKNPRGIVVNAADTRAYVMNQVSRDVTVVDLTTTPESVLATVPSASLPEPGTFEDWIHVGRELYHTSVGDFDPPAPGTPPLSGRLSNSGWGACSGCHPFGLSDNVVWIFDAGPRRTLPQHADFDPTDLLRGARRKLHWSAERDEQADFELNIRQVSGGQGLIVAADGATPATGVANLVPLASGGRNQVKVRGIPAWDALQLFVQYGIRAPISPTPDSDPEVVAGRALFERAGCQRCHGGPQWTRSAASGYTPPPHPGFLQSGQLFGELTTVGTFDRFFFNEVRANATAPLGVLGFVPPSLLSLFAFPGAFLHNGRAPTLDAVLENVAHRSAGTSGVDTLASPADRADLVHFLKSIDAGTAPIPPPPCTFVGKWGSAGSGPGQFFHPAGVFVDRDGNVWVADAQNYRIQKFTNTGTFLTQWGSFGAGPGHFDRAFGVRADQHGHVFVLDTGNNRIQKFTDGGTYLTEWGGLGSGDGQLNSPFGFYLDRSGNVYVSDSLNHRIQKFTNDGVFLTKWGSFGSGDGQFNRPYGIAVDGNGDVYVADRNNFRVQKFSSAGTFVAKWGSAGSGDGQFTLILNFAIHPNGDVYVTDRYRFNPSIQKFTNTGTFLAKLGFAGSADGQFSAAFSMAFDPAGNLYVSDSAEVFDETVPNNNRIQKFACP